MPSAGAPHTATPDLTSAIRDLVRYRQEHLTGDEKGEAQVYCERLFRAFGHEGLPEAGATLETCLTKNDAKGNRFR